MVKNKSSRTKLGLQSSLVELRSLCPLQLFVTVELEPDTRLWLLKPYKNLKLLKQFVHAGKGNSLLTNAPWIVPVFSVKTRESRRQQRWTRLDAASVPAFAFYTDGVCAKLVKVLCTEASQRRSGGQDHNFKSISSLSLFGYWPAFPLCFTAGDVEEDRISSITAASDELLIAPMLKTDEQKELEKEREKDGEFRYMCEWLAKQTACCIYYLQVRQASRMRC